jgi:hypothetical protein
MGPIMNDFKLLKQHIVEQLTPKVEPITEAFLDDAMHERLKEFHTHMVVAKALHKLSDSLPGEDVSHHNHDKWQSLKNRAVYHEDSAHEVNRIINGAASALSVAPDDMAARHKAAYDEVLSNIDNGNY